MLHTLMSIKLSNTLELNSHAYNIFDTRTFRSNITMEQTFETIYNDFIRIFNNSIKPFLDGIIKQDNFYVKHISPVFTIEEAVYLKSHDIDSNTIKYYQTRNTEIRLFAVPNINENYMFEIVETLAYSKINNRYDKLLSVFINETNLSTLKGEELNDMLFKIINSLSIAYIDFRLSRDNNVPLNSTYTYNFCWNSDSIVLPERFIYSDCMFIYWYYKCLFKIILSITNEDIIDSFDTYIDRVLLPIMFNEESEDENDDEYHYFMFREIWNNAYKSVFKDYSESNEDLIDICAKIYKYIEIDINEDLYLLEAIKSQQE